MSPWRSGYDRTDVDRFVAAAIHELERLQEANTVAGREIERLRNYFHNRGIEVGCAGGAYCRSGHAARSTAADGDERATVSSKTDHHDSLVDEQTFVGRVTWPATQRVDAS